MIPFPTAAVVDIAQQVLARLIGDSVQDRRSLRRRDEVELLVRREVDRWRIGSQLTDQVAMRAVHELCVLASRHPCLQVRDDALEIGLATGADPGMELQRQLDQLDALVRERRAEVDDVATPATDRRALSHPGREIVGRLRTIDATPVSGRSVRHPDWDALADSADAAIAQRRGRRGNMR